MIVPADNRFTQSLIPHSMSLMNDMQVPSAGFGSMPNIARDKVWSGPPPLKGAWANRFNPVGLSGLTFDGSGLLGTGLFSGDVSTWGTAELVAIPIIGYAIYSMFFQAKQTHIKAQGAVHRKRKSKAAKLRERAKALESKPLGSFSYF